MAGNGVRPLSETPEAIRQRRFQEKKREATRAKPTPTHDTEQIDGDGPDEFAGSPFVGDADAEHPKPLVPELVAAVPEGTKDANAPAAPVGRVTSPEEAKLYAHAVGEYFEFGTGLMLVKQPEFASGLVGVAAKGDILAFRKNFAKARAFVESCAERVIIKYNLAIPFMDEAVCLGAIGIATFGIAGKPSPAGKIAMAHMEAEMKAEGETAQASNGVGVPADAKNANTPPPPQTTNGVSNGARVQHAAVPDGGIPNVNTPIVIEP